MVLGFASEGNIGSFLKVLDRVMEDGEFSSFFRDFDFPWYFPGGEYQDLVEGAGFRDCRVGYRSVEMEMTVEDLTGWFRTTGMPYWGRLPGPLAERFVGRVIDDYVKSRQGRGIALGFKRIIVEGRK